MTVDNLVRVVPPAAAPLEAFAGPWEPIETQLGVIFPPDYKEFVRIYGSGCFMEFLWILAPWSSDGGAEFLGRVRQVAHAFRILPLPHPLWPSPGGLIPLGSTDNDDRLFWLPRPAPEPWSILIWDRGGDEGLDTQMFDGGVIDFLAGLAAGKIAPVAFPDDLLDCDQLFRPAVA